MDSLHEYEPNYLRNIVITTGKSDLLLPIYTTSKIMVKHNNCTKMNQRV